MGGPDATPNLWKQPFSAVRASGGYPGNDLNQWWLVYRRIYASQGLSELIVCRNITFIVNISKKQATIWRKTTQLFNSGYSLRCKISIIHVLKICPLTHYPHDAIRWDVISVKINDPDEGLFPDSPKPLSNQILTCKLSKNIFGAFLALTFFVTKFISFSILAFAIFWHPPGEDVTRTQRVNVLKGLHIREITQSWSAFIQWPHAVSH